MSFHTASRSISAAFCSAAEHLRNIAVKCNMITRMKSDNLTNNKTVIGPALVCLSGRLLMRSVGLLALSLCLLLAIVPLYFVWQPDGIGPHWSTVFDLPSDWYILSSHLIGGRGLPLAAIFLMRYALLLLVGGIVAICVFKRFRLRWLPLLMLGIITAQLAFDRFYPILGQGINSLGFVLLVALCVDSFFLVLLHFRCRDS
jgi:hypothetical protein